MAKTSIHLHLPEMDAIRQALQEQATLLSAIEVALIKLLAASRQTFAEVDTVANELADLTREVAENADATQSAIALIQGLKAKLDAAIAAGDMSAVKRLSDALSANSDALAAAVAANTPSNSPTVPTGDAV